MAQSTSAIVTSTAPALVGVWMHDPTNATTTISNYVFGNIGRTETVAVQGTPLQFIGRTYPVYNTGTFETQTVKASILIPSGPTEQTQADWFRTMVRNRRTVCYRDNRGRKLYVIILEVDFTDVREGTAVQFTATTVDYSEGI